MIDCEVDYTDYSSSENVQLFLDKIENWKNLKSIEKVEKNEEVPKFLSLSSQDMKNMTANECFHASYVLYGYANRLQSILNRENSVYEWSNESINHIVCNKINNYGDGYTKWEQKYYSAIKENPLANELFKLRVHCLSRVKTIEKLSNTVERMANVLEQVARNK